MTVSRRSATTDLGSAGAADPLGRLRAALRSSALSLVGDATLSGLRLEAPPRADLGDYSTNAAMLLAPALDRAPRDAAQRLADVLAGELGDQLERAEVAGPGFLNLSMASGWYRASLAGMVAAGEEFGAGVAAPAERVLVEFVSANPTGPITVASGRHAAYGDSLCRILAFAGHEVQREYYVNDHGTQVLLFGASIGARARGEEPPEEGYRGPYVAELADRIDGAADLGAEELAVAGVELMVADVRQTLERFRVSFDRFTSERSLYEGGGLERAVELLDEQVGLYESEGATWLRTSAFGDDKDRVVTRSSGEPTYLASDIAYHADKLARGYDRAIDVLGADHHGYVERLRAAWQALGGDADRLEILIMQLVNLVEAGERAQMSKRKGEFVTLDDLIDDLGVDAARYFLLQRNHDTTLDLDLALAREQSQENPVYYVQYAHARIASILRKAVEEGAIATPPDEIERSAEDLHPSARVLVKRLLDFPTEVEQAAARRAPHRLTTYAHEVAQGFSAFYRDCRVIGAAEEGGDEGLRLALCEQAGRVIARSLHLLGVAAPERM
jgi:arginyl-tRNA synthetase